MELAPGVVVAENIRLVRRIGEGGMGSVWEAEHAGLRATVAVKILSAGVEDRSDAMVARFRREAHAAGRIKSPHVVQIFDSGTLMDGTPYIVMELLEGRDLGERIEDDGPLPLSEVVTIVSQVGRALAKAHKLGVVHRDVKPENVFLLDEDGEPFAKVLDFGLAKRFDVRSHSVVTMTGTMVGTPAFMSPEQVLSNKSVDARSDIWSLGVLTYNALTGDIPFTGDNLGAMCVAIAAGEFPPITDLRNNLPKALDSWFDRVLAVNPDLRFASVKEAVEALRQAAEGIATSEARTIVRTHADAFGDIATAKAAEAMKRPVNTHTESIHLPIAGPSRKKVIGVALVSLAIGGALAVPVMLATEDESTTTAEPVASEPAPLPAPSATPTATVAATVAPSVVSTAAPTTEPPPPPVAPPKGVQPRPTRPAKPGPVDRGF